MRNCFRKLKQDGKNILEVENQLGEAGRVVSDQDPNNRGKDNENDGSGEIQDQGEFGLGRAPRDSKPINKIELTKEKEAEIQEAQAYEEYQVSEAGDSSMGEGNNIDVRRSKNRPKKRKGIDMQTAFLEFKHEQSGTHLEESIRDNRNELKEMKNEVKELTEKCNVSKKNIDVVKSELDKKQDERKESMQHQFNRPEDGDALDEEDAPQEIVDEEELTLMIRLKELKKTYRTSFINLKNKKGQLSMV